MGIGTTDYTDYTDFLEVRNLPLEQVSIKKRRRQAPTPHADKLPLPAEVRFFDQAVEPQFGGLVLQDDAPGFQHIPVIRYFKG
jgi:hypothetical protein